MGAGEAGKTAERAPRTPNNVLRGIRENERHETRKEFAAAMARIAWEMGVEVYPDENYVERLESGHITWPHRTYRNILEKLCDRSAYKLGLASSLNLDDEERVIQAIRRPIRVDSSVVSPLAKMLAAHRETEDVIGALPLIKPVTAQLAVLENLVKDSRGPGRPEIIDIAAQWAEYAGWIHASTGYSPQSLEWFGRALEWSVETDNAHLAAHSLSFRGYVYFMHGEIGPMIGVARAAQRDSSVWVGQRGYDAYLEARGLAMLGDSEAAVKKIHEGEERALLASGRGDDRPPWNYYCTPGFYALERGLVYRFLGRDDHAHNNEAIASLTAALDDIGEARSSEWAADYIYHLAVAYVQSGSPDKACETALEILQVACAKESRRLMKQLEGMYARLAKRWPNDPCVKEFGETLH